MIDCSEFLSVNMVVEPVEDGCVSGHKLEKLGFE